MRRLIAVFTTILMALMLAVPASAQKNQATVTVTLKDATSGEPISYATVSLTTKSNSKTYKYTLSDEKGVATMENVKSGTYILKAEMMGLQTFEKEVTVKDGVSVNMGVAEMKIDQQLLDAASVVAVGNPIIIKKDTIEYNASSFKTTENDMLEDLLKKLPGIEVGSDGSITANGQKITKIYVDGKTYFMDDPTLASKNLPAKIVEKVKVIQKKSDQAEFTGIDDGEEETVLDLTVQQGMMDGLMGNVRAAGGHDVPVTSTELTSYEPYNDWRFSSNVFLGNFSNGAQYSIIANANNANNMGFGGMGGGMMGGGMMGGGMMGGGNGGGGVTTSYMLGANLGYDLFDDKMELTGNYAYTGSNTDSWSKSYTERYYEGYSQLSNTENTSNSNSDGHRIGMRIEHEFSKSSSIIFEPNINFSTNHSNSGQIFDTKTLNSGSSISTNTNDGFSRNLSDGKNVNASGRLQYRQRLGLPGRTLVVNGNFSLSNNTSDGFTQSLTNNYLGGNQVASIINQRTEQVNKSTSASARATYTEPLGNHFYVEGNYSANWSRTNSVKDAFDSGNNDGFTQATPVYVKNGETRSSANSSNIINENLSQNIGLDLLYQDDDLTAQVGMSLTPNKIHNKTDRDAYKIDTTYSVVNWSPQVMVVWRPGDNWNLRFNYRGSSRQPSVDQLIPVLDNTNPISQSLGNPYLAPSFSHNINNDIRFSNRKNFTSFNIRLGGGFNQNPVVNATWTDKSIGKTYSMPVNGPTTGNFNVNFFGNFPIAKSNFSISTNTSASTSNSASYVGSNIDTYKFYDIAKNEFDYIAFREAYPNMNKSADFARNDTRTTNLSERLTFVYSSNAVELRVGASTNYSKSTYSINSENNLKTFRNALTSSLTWNWALTGMTLKSDFDYRWYRGFTTEMPSEAILNAEISKLIFNNRATIALSATDILGQTKSFSVSDTGNYHSETLSNTLGRYILVSFTWRFGTFGGGRGGRGGHGGGMPMGGGRGGFGGGRPM